MYFYFPKKTYLAIKSNFHRCSNHERQPQIDEHFGTFINRNMTGALMVTGALSPFKRQPHKIVKHTQKINPVY